MKYLSVCSGIEAASVAWETLGWSPVAFSEIEPFPSSVLAHHFPGVPNLGDMSLYENWNLPKFDILVGGTPCQSFSLAGLRKGLHDPRGGLMLTFLEIARTFRPTWVVWENVPGVLTSGRGRDFGSLLGGLEELGYGWSYRVLDAQYFGVPQRRRRVFVVARLGGLPGCWRELFFEPEGVRRDSAPSRGAREEAAAVARRGAQSLDVDSDGLHFFDAYQHHCWRESDTAGTLTANLSRGVCGDSPLAVSVTGSIDHTLKAETFVLMDQGGGVMNVEHERTGTLRAQTHGHEPIVFPAVRRLTPVECERLQGFPDGWTDVPHKGKPAADSPRYKAIGNSMAVPCMRWIGKKIEECANV